MIMLTAGKCIEIQSTHALGLDDLIPPHMLTIRLIMQKHLLNKTYKELAAEYKQKIYHTKGRRITLLRKWYIPACFRIRKLELLDSEISLLSNYVEFYEMMKKYDEEK